MGKKSRKPKLHKKNITKEIKNVEDRKNIVEKALNKIDEIELSREIPGIIQFNKICNEYIVSGINKSGKIELSGVKRELHYILPTSKHIDVSLILKYNDKV